MHFSVLMSIYYKENPEWLDRSLMSIFYEQTVKPSQIVLVKDGPLTPLLDLVISRWKESLGSIFSVISLDVNVGLGRALSEGLKYCNYELVARMDTDDIAYQDRFEKQIAYFTANPDVDVLGGWITEFEDREDNIYNYRRLPLEHETLCKYAKTRCPFNHMTVMFKKSKVIDVGSYPEFRVGQDYPLWIRIIQSGGKLANLPEYLVNMRSGRDMARRRRNFGRIKNEIALQYTMYKTGFISLPRLLFNGAGRTIFRLLPGKVALQVYKKAWK